LIFSLWAGFAQAEIIRVATYAAPLSRDGPGLLLRDLRKGEDPQIAHIMQTIQLADPDILILTDIDYDHDWLSLTAVAERLSDDPLHLFTMIPNSGLQTGLDVDRNGYAGDARDAQGYGRFAGDGGLAVISRFPIAAENVTDHSAMLWRDLKGRTLPRIDGEPFLNDEALNILRLSSTGHWMVPIDLPDGSSLIVLTYAATPPVFDGPEDMNGLRARDELRLWEHVLDGVFAPPPSSFILAGNSNLDPNGGDGDRAAMARFLARSDLQDPHTGSYNADWGSDGPGMLRVSYLLPSTDWLVIDAGTIMPDANSGISHGLVWLDIAR